MHPVSETADPAQRIKKHILDLNSVGFRDEPALDNFLTALRDTISDIFGSNHQYITYLGSINVRPVFAAVPRAESVRCWGVGRRKIRELLVIMLQDIARRPLDEARAGFELKEAERIVSRHVHSLGDLGRIPRLRVDLRDINIMDAKVNDYLMGLVRAKNKAGTHPVLFSPARDEQHNAQVLNVLRQTSAAIIRTEELLRPDLPLHDRLGERQNLAAAVLVLGKEAWTKTPAGKSMLVPSAAFLLGHLIARLGSARVIGLYNPEDTPLPEKPADLILIPMDAPLSWTEALLKRLHAASIDPRDTLL